jgi:hypothetical protein
MQEMKGDNRIKELLPGIETAKEKVSFAKLDSHQSQLKNEELYFRMMQRGS